MFYLPGKRAHSPVSFANGRLRGRIVDEFDSEELRTRLADPDSLFAVPGVEILKDDRRSTVARLQLDGTGLVVKRNNAVSMLKAWKRGFAPSRGARAWYAAHMMEALEVDTAPPVAYVERRHGPIRGRSWVVLGSLTGMHAREYLTHPDTTRTDGDRMIDAIVDIYARLHRANVTHGDNRPQNFIIVGDRPHIIDLDVAVVHPPWSHLRNRYMRRDIRRLLEHWRKDPEIQARFRSSLERHGLAAG